MLVTTLLAVEKWRQEFCEDMLIRLQRGKENSHKK